MRMLRVSSDLSVEDLKCWSATLPLFYSATAAVPVASRPPQSDTYYCTSATVITVITREKKMFVVSLFRASRSLGGEVYHRG